MEILANIMNFKVRLFTRNDGNFASKDPQTGIWSGMAADLIYDDADFASLFGLNADRSEVMDFMASITEQFSGFIIKRQPTESLSFTTFTFPFHWKLWLTILVMCIVGSIILWLSQYYPNVSHMIIDNMYSVKYY